MDLITKFAYAIIWPYLKLYDTLNRIATWRGYDETDDYFRPQPISRIEQSHWTEPYDWAVPMLVNYSETAYQPTPATHPIP